MKNVQVDPLNLLTQLINNSGMSFQTAVKVVLESISEKSIVVTDDEVKVVTTPTPKKAKTARTTTTTTRKSRPTKKVKTPPEISAKLCAALDGTEFMTVAAVAEKTGLDVNLTNLALRDAWKRGIVYLRAPMHGGKPGVAEYRRSADTQAMWLQRNLDQ